MDPLVSIIIPTYKRPDTLLRAVNSVLSSDYQHIEVIVVDDNSPETKERENTRRVMEQYKNIEKICYIQHPRNMNGSAARNTGFRASHGQYIMFLDDDDEFMPSKISTQLQCMENRDESWGACYTDYIQVNTNGETVMKNGEKREGNLYIEELMRNLFIHAGSNLMIRREAFESIGGFDENFNRNQDIEMLTRLLKRYKLAYAKGLGLVVHMHSNANGSTESFEKTRDAFLSRFKDEINALTDTDKKRVHTMIKLQTFRYGISRKGKRKIALALLMRREVNLQMIVRYMAHLINRKLRKRSYGFKI